MLFETYMRCGILNSACEIATTTNNQPFTKVTWVILEIGRWYKSKNNLETVFLPQGIHFSSCKTVTLALIELDRILLSFLASVEAVRNYWWILAHKES